MSDGMGRELAYLSSHATNRFFIPNWGNRCSIGICYEGGLNEHAQPCDTRTPEQTERIVDVLSRLHRLFPKAKIVGHRDLPGTTPKECPCLDAHALFGWIEEL